MSFYVDRVRQTDCRTCGKALDIADAKPLSRVWCPSCGAENIVPVVLETFLITRVIGSGTSGMIYAGVDQANQHRKVAIKVFTKDESRDDRITRAIAEAKALRDLRHPNIVKVYAIGTTGGQPYVVMELLDGGSLKDAADEATAMAEERVLEIAIDIAEALKRTSERGMLHLDVKPGNILFDSHGVPKLLDFGYAAVTADMAANEILGTPYYVAPELVRRMTPDHRCDIYSLGATMYHLATGRPPFDGETIKQIVLSRLQQPAPDPRGANPQLSKPTAQVIMKMMATDLSQRYSSYDELLTDLRHARFELDQAAEAKAARLWDEQGGRAADSTSGAATDRRGHESLTRGLVIAAIAVGVIGLAAVIWSAMNRGEVEPVVPPAASMPMDPPTPAAAPVEAAAPKPVIVAVEASGTLDGEPASNTMDGDLITRWSAQGEGQWIAFRFDQPAAFDRVTIAWSRGGERIYIFDLEASDDGATWRPIYSGHSSGKGLKPEVHRFSPATASHLRIVCKGSNLNDWSYITEVTIGDLQFAPR